MKVFIRPRRTSATQSAVKSKQTWEIVPSLQDALTPDPLMGWKSSGDTNQELLHHLRFDSVEQATEFATQKGWQSHIITKKEKRLTPRNYMQNFK